MGILLGAIADDFTGATDLANTLVKEGMRVVQIIGVPDACESTRECRCCGGCAQIALSASWRGCLTIARGFALVAVAGSGVNCVQILLHL